MMSRPPGRAIALSQLTAVGATGPSCDAADRASRVLWIGILVLAGVYVVLFLGGVRFFVWKTAVLPLFLLYALMLRDRAVFLADWMPVIAGTLLFDALRGAIFVAIGAGYQVYYVDYVIAIERAVIGISAAPVAFQPFRTPALDAMAVAIHATHFAYFLLFGLVLWHVRHPHFWLFCRALLLVMLLGLIGYALVPTAPPWLAVRLGILSDITHVAADIYTYVLPDLHRTFDTNPVAAMPSLHTAFPVMCALVGWRAYGRCVASLLTAYALIVGVVVIYLGEHYLVDVLAGVVTACVAVWLAYRTRRFSFSSRTSFGFSGVGVGATVAIVLLVN